LDFLAVLSEVDDLFSIRRKAEAPNVSRPGAVIVALHNVKRGRLQGTISPGGNEAFRSLAESQRKARLRFAFGHPATLNKPQHLPRRVLDE